MGSPGRLRFSRPVLVATSGYYGEMGSSFVMRTLLGAFDPETLILAIRRPPGPRREVPSGGLAPRFAMSRAIEFSATLDQVARTFEMPLATGRLVALAKRRACKVVVGVFPNFQMLAASFYAARLLRVPFVAYLHDTVAPTMSRYWGIGSFARVIEESVFKRAAHLFVMSQGMAELLRKEGVPAEPLLHPYPDPISAHPCHGTATRTALWSGSVYEINRRSLCRVAWALEEQGAINLILTTHQTQEVLSGLGLPASRWERKFFAERADYLAELQNQAFHILALDWPDESRVHPTELSTIFPTKTIDYLASGRPILVHAPQEYFLARFFLERNCGLVVSSRDPACLREAIEDLASDSELGRARVQNALAVAREYALEKVAGLFHRRIEDLLGSRPALSGDPP